MIIDNNKKFIEGELLENIRRSLPDKKLTRASAFSILNGLARMQLKVINDFDRSFDAIASTLMKELLYSLYIEKGKGSKDISSNEVLMLYKNNLLEEFSSKVKFDVFTAKNFDEKEVEKELVRLSYLVLKSAVFSCAREREDLDEPSLENINKCLEDYKMVKRILSEGLGEEISVKKGKDGEEKVDEYLNKIVHDLIEEEVDYFDKQMEFIIRAESSKELDRQEKERNEIDRSLAYYDRTIR